MSRISDVYVLIIDDNKEHAKELQKAAKEELKMLNENATVFIACRPAETKKRIRQLQGEERVYVLADIVLGTDWKHDGQQVDGWGLLAEIRESLPNSKIVLYSAVQEKGDLEQALKLGAYDLVLDAGIEKAKKGLLAALASFATIERRLREAEQGSDDDRPVDPLAQLLLKVKIGLSIIGRHGHVWFQNKYNVEINTCKARGGFRCHREFHHWRCLTGQCPWCPTLEAVSTGVPRQRALLLPVRIGEGSSKYRIECIEMASEPLWTYMEGYEKRIAGAVESVLLRTKEWEGKEPIQRILDITTMLAGFIADSCDPFRINVYEVAASGLLYRPAVSCIVSASDNGAKYLEAAVELAVWGPMSGWTGRASEPGPACSVARVVFREDNLEFCVEEDEIAGYGPDFVQFDRSSDSETVAQAAEAGLWNVPGLDGEALQWKRICLKKPRPSTIIEVGTAHDVAIPCFEPGHGVASAPGEESRSCDLQLYVHLLDKVVTELREQRASQRAKDYPQRPDLGSCRSRAALWQQVSAEIERLSRAMELPPEAIWWHYRDLKFSETSSGKRQYYLEMADDATRIGASPYARAALDVHREVQLPPPSQWADVAARFCDDESAVEGVRDSEQIRSGSYLCRVSGKIRLAHTRPKLEKGRGYTTVLDYLSRTSTSYSDKRRVEELHSYGDFPVGDELSPLGTFHIQSTDRNLFGPEQVRKYFVGLVGEIDRVLSRIRADATDEKLSCLRRTQHRFHFIGKMIIARQLDIDRQLLDVLKLATADTVRKEDLERGVIMLRGRLKSLDVLRVLQTSTDIHSSESLEETELNDILMQCIKDTQAQIASDPLWKGRLRPILKSAAIQQMLVQARPKLLRAGLLETLYWAFSTLYADRDLGNENPEISVALTGDNEKFTLEVGLPTTHGEELFRHYKTVCEALPSSEYFYGGVLANPDPSYVEQISSLLLSRLLMEESFSHRRNAWDITIAAVRLTLQWESSISLPEEARP